jgi:hypothetical protein
MKDPRYIMEGIDLLMREKHKGPRIPWWIKPVDWLLTAVYLGALVFLILKLTPWL